jgi:hypothetical protein
MLRHLLLLSVFCLLPVFASGHALQIQDAVLTTAVVDREPIDHVEAAPRQNGILYCYTRVLGAEDETMIYHLWYYGEELMSRVELPVKSASWRTWSAKQLLEDWSGACRVEIQDADGRLLKELSFEVR